MKKEIVWMDYARYIGIFLVIFGHSLQRFSWDECSFVKTLWDYIYLFHMPLFFIISGYLYDNRAVNVANIRFGGGKILRSLIVPYLLYQIVFLPISLYTSHGLTDIVVWKKMFMGILMGDGYDTPYSYYVCLPCWFIVSIIQIRWLFLIVPINKFSSSLLSITSIGLLVYLNKHNIDLYFCLDSTMMAIPYFLIGHYLRYSVCLENRNNRFLLILATISAICVGVILKWNGAAQMNGPGYGVNIFCNYMAGIAGTISVCSLSKIAASYLNNKNYIRTISRNTLFLIFFHWLLLAVCGFIINKIFRNIYTDGTCIIVSSLILSQIILFVSWKVISYGACRFPVLFGKQKKLKK